MPENNKNKGGRPTTENGKNRVISTRLNEAEYAVFLEKREAAGYKTNGPFLRELTASGRAAPRKTQKRINQNFYVELSRIGNNLNQIAKRSNAGSNPQFDPSLLAEVRDLLQELRKEISNDC